MKRKNATYILMFQLFLSIIFLSALMNLSHPSYSPGMANPIDTTPALSSAGWSPVTIISDNASLWNNGSSQFPAMTFDKDGGLHVVWTDETDGPWGDDTEIMYAKYSGGSWTAPVVISDGYSGSYWNDGSSQLPDIVVDASGTIHVVWSDATAGWWETDTEIMYVNYTASTGWSNATIISDDATLWNTGYSSYPAIHAGPNGVIHAVWHDNTAGPWRYNIGDYEIMYTNYTPGIGWFNATIISDDHTFWNNGQSWGPDIVVGNSGTIHVVWQDYSHGWWGDDQEIMYVNFTIASGWANATVISDDASDWNNESSSDPTIAIGPNGDLHVVWNDWTNGWWGDDVEIMYTTHTESMEWTQPLVISDDGSLWNDGPSAYPTIAVDDSGSVHVAWQDATDGPWYNLVMISEDTEIWYRRYTPGGEWSDFELVSEEYPGTLWNTRESQYPAIAADGGQVHIVWEDRTQGWWSTGSSDSEIMHSIFVLEEEDGAPGVLFALIIIFPLIGACIAAFIIYKRRKVIID